MLIPILELFYAFDVDPVKSSLVIFLAYLILFSGTLWFVKDSSVNKKYQNSLSKDHLILLAKIGTISALTSAIFLIGILIHLATGGN